MPPDERADAEAAPEATRIALLRARNLHVTPQRLGVLRALSVAPHSTADEVYRIVRAELGAVSRQAVYDALGALTGRGVLRRIEPAGSPARYEDRVGDNHHHLVCRTCGRLVDVDCAQGEAPCLTPSGGAGYEVDEAEVIYWGRCPACVARAAPGEQQPGEQRHPGNSPNHERDRVV